MSIHDELEQQEARRLQGLAQRFQQALRAREQGDIDSAAELLRGILKAEPRLAEPRMELAHILLSTGQLDEGEEQARDAIRILESGGQWTDDLPEDVLLALAYDTLGEALRLRADSDAVVFGPESAWLALVSEARTIFRKASALDPDNDHAWFWSFDTDQPSPRRTRPDAEADEDDGEAGEDDGEE